MTTTADEATPIARRTIMYYRLTVIVDGELLMHDKVLPDTATRLFNHLRDIHLHTRKNVTLNIANESEGTLALFKREGGLVVRDSGER